MCAGALGGLIALVHGLTQSDVQNIGRYAFGFVMALALAIALAVSTARVPTRPEWLAEQAGEQGWSREVLAVQIDRRLHERHGKALTNFTKALPPATSDLAAQIFKDPYLFDMLGTADPRRGAKVGQALVVELEPVLLPELLARDDQLRERREQDRCLRPRGRVVEVVPACAVEVLGPAVAVLECARARPILAPSGEGRGGAVCARRGRAA